MSLILILKELWDRRVFVAAAVVVAALAALFGVYQVSVVPPSVSERSDYEARGSIEILVDSARSPIADARRDLTGLTARAGVFARLIAGGNVVRRIAEDSGVPFGRIEVAGPAPLPGEAPGAEGASVGEKPYGIAVTQPEGLPLLSVETRAPTVKAARALAAAAPAAIGEVVRSVQQEQRTAADKRIEFRALGPTEVSFKNEAPGAKVALAVFVAILAMLLLAVLGGPRLVAAWRSTDPDEEHGLHAVTPPA